MSTVTISEKNFKSIIFFSSFTHLWVFPPNDRSCYFFSGDLKMGLIKLPFICDGFCPPEPKMDPLQQETLFKKIVRGLSKCVHPECLQDSLLCWAKGTTPDEKVPE